MNKNIKNPEDLEQEPYEIISDSEQLKKLKARQQMFLDRKREESR